jgi:uncharacterized protein (TIGR03437 family)
MKRHFTLCLLLALPVSLCGQQPRIFSIANAASLYTPPQDAAQPGLGVAAGSIIAIFGSNLARTAKLAEGFPLPKTLESTSVTIGGLEVPLFFVSPEQVNAMVPSSLALNSNRRGDFQTFPVVVRVGSQESSQYILRISEVAPGIFTVDGSGCGQGLIYQSQPDGTVSMNGPDNSANPGESVITILGTGAGRARATEQTPIVPPDGDPAPPGDLKGWVVTPFLAEIYAFIHWLRADPLNQLDSTYTSGRQPGLVAVDFTRFLLPENTPEGCAVPVRWSTGHNMSQNVTMAVRRGGGPCVDPPVESIALITWERTVTSGLRTEMVNDDLRVEFFSGSGRSLPERDTIPQNWGHRTTWAEMEGPSCPLPSDILLNAGEITVRGPDWGPIRIRPDESNTYRATLPRNAIHEGAFAVTGSGGTDVGPFETTLQIPPPIEPRAIPPGTRIPCCWSLVGLPGALANYFTWTGGGDDSWVRVSVLSRADDLGRKDWLHESEVIASKGGMLLFAARYLGYPPSRDAEVTFTQDAVTPVKFEAPGLTRGGLHRYFYKWRYTGLSVRGLDDP